jgi:hypothetical protein
MLESRRGIGLGDGMMCCCWAYGHWDVFLLDEKTRLSAGNVTKSKKIGGNAVVVRCRSEDLLDFLAQDAESL